jgi:hypothetical protein
MNAVTVKPAMPVGFVDAQSAFELPDRQLLALVTVVITNLLNNLSIDVAVQNNKVAVQVCAAVTAISSLVATPLDCDIRQ